MSVCSACSGRGVVMSPTSDRAWYCPECGNDRAGREHFPREPDEPAERGRRSHERDLMAEAGSMREALGIIRRMRLFPDDKINRSTLSAAILIANRALGTGEEDVDATKSPSVGEASKAAQPLQATEPNTSEQPRSALGEG